MKYLAVIPARSGSKRVPGKNIRMLSGKRLIDWSIDFAKKISWINEIYVSTDIPELINAYDDNKVVCNDLRPAYLSHDTARTEDVINNVLEKYQQKNISIENIVLLQPTSPFRTISRIERARRIFEKEKSDNVVSVSKLDLKLSWLLRKEGNVHYRQFSDEFDNIDFDYFDGSFFITSTRNFLVNQSFVSKDLIGVLPDHHFESCDIDTENDFAQATAYSEAWLNVFPH